jgi:hypothetical protein
MTKTPSLLDARECGDYPRILAPHFHEPGAKELNYAIIIVESRQVFQCMTCGFSAAVDSHRELFILHVTRHAGDVSARGPLEAPQAPPAERTGFDDLTDKIRAESTPTGKPSRAVITKAAPRALRQKRTSAIMENVRNAKGEVMAELLLPADVMAWKTGPHAGAFKFPVFMREAWDAATVKGTPAAAPKVDEATVRRGVYMPKTATHRIRELEATGFDFSAWAVAACRAAAKRGL